MDNQQKTQNRYKDDISLRDIFLNIGAYISFFWKKKWWIILATIAGGIFFVWRGWNKPEYFEGSISFVVNEDGGGGNVGSILGQIGIPSESTVQTSAQLQAFSKSRRIIYRVLLDSVKVNGETDLWGNHFIRIHQLKDWFEKISPSLADYNFTTADTSDFRRVDFTMLKLLHLKILSQDDNFYEVDYDEETGFYKLLLRANAEDLVLTFLNRIYTNLQELYVKNTVGSQEKTLNELIFRSDSIYNELNQVEYQLAQSEDRSLGLISRYDRVRLDQLQREAALLNGIYLEILRNKETAEFLLNTNRPSFEIVDPPAFPLASFESKPIENAFWGCLFGGFLSALGFLVFKAFKDIMREPSST
ncbi:MAG: hypothetical protein AAFY36_04215 [Bacteroidota bacterium]